MKKTTFFLLGALMASVMPGNGLRAQNVDVNIDVRTLDRSALVGATIYAANPGQTYFVDTAHLMPTWTGSALEVNDANVLASTVMTLSYNNGGFSASATVDSTLYSNAFIVMTDAYQRCYILGTSTRQSLDTGYFAAAPLMSQAVNGQFYRLMTANGTIIGTERGKVIDGGMFTYTSLPNALLYCADSAVLSFMDTIRVDAPVNITRPTTVYQMGYPFISTAADASTGIINVTGAELSWFGNATSNDIVISAGSGDIFNVDASTLALRQFGASSNARPVYAHNGSTVTVAGCILNSTSDAEAVRLEDSSNAAISTLNVTSASFAEYSDGATGRLTILDSTAAATAATIGADAYYRSGNYRLYYRTLTLAAAAAAVNDTVFLARNTVLNANSTPDTINKGVVVDLQGHILRGSLYIGETEDTVFLQNGQVNYLAGVDSANAVVVINNLDSVATLSPKDLSVIVNNARILVVNPATGADVVVLGGKYGQDVSGYLPPRYTIVPNMDADSIPFRYTVGEGYRVTFVNYNARIGQAGYADSIAIVNTADNRIVPAPSRPSYVSLDTVFCAYYVNPEYTTPWNFLNDVLTSDTVLYAKWDAFDPMTEGRYTVYHHRQALDGTFPETMVDSAFGVYTLGDSLIVPANVYSGFTPDKYFDTTATFVDGIVINFNYVRNQHTVTYVLNGGTVEPGVDTVVTVLYGDAVSYPTVTRPGYTLTGWNPNIITMPDYDCTTYAVYTRNTYPVAWSHVDTTVIYNGTDRSEIVATYRDDNGNDVNALVTITDAEGNEVSSARNVGVYTFTAAPVDTNYQLGNLTNTLTIVPAAVVGTNISVVTVKLYDGNNSAAVTNMGVPSPIYANDDLTLTTTATYDNAEVGDNKTVTAHLTLGGADAANYTLVTPSQMITTAGAIVAPFVLNTAAADNGIGGVTASGYCAGDNSAIQFYLTSGTPNQYKIVFDGATDTNWTNITTAGNANLVIPVDAAYGSYNATLTLRNSAYPQFESAAIPFSFVVNLSREYTKPIFSDVISIVDTCHCIDQSSIKWYHNGTYVGDGPYYQEVGGLTGSYHVTMTMNGDDVQTCEQYDVVTLVEEAASVEATVSAYPNPAVDQVNVTIENSYSATHTLRVMNVMGVTLVNTTFEGNSTVVDFSAFGAGSYTVSVDGAVARVIKY